MTYEERLDVATELKEMDEFIRNYDGDESIIIYWLQEGIEDHLNTWTEEDYLEYVNDYDSLIEVYRECQEMMEEEDC